MKISHKLLVGFLGLTLLIWVVGFYAVSASEQSLRESIVNTSGLLAVNLIDETDNIIEKRADMWLEYAMHPKVRDRLRESNLRFERMPEARAYIDINTEPGT